MGEYVPTCWLSQGLMEVENWKKKDKKKGTETEQEVFFTKKLAELRQQRMNMNQDTLTVLEH